MKLIGIDTGVRTGVAVWDVQKRAYIALRTLTITRAMELVLDYRRSDEVKLYIEDARLNKWVGRFSQARAMGAGSVMRDAHVWEDWCVEQQIKYVMVNPRDNATKLDRKMFIRLTYCPLPSNEHSRDAAMLVWHAVNLLNLEPGNE